MTEAAIALAYWIVLACYQVRRELKREKLDA